MRLFWEDVAFVIANILPREIVYQCFVRLVAEAADTQPRVSVVDMTTIEAAKRWNR